MSNTTMDQASTEHKSERIEHQMRHGSRQEHRSTNQLYGIIGHIEDCRDRAVWWTNSWKLLCVRLSGIPDPESNKSLCAGIYAAPAYISNFVTMVTISDGDSSVFPRSGR